MKRLTPCEGEIMQIIWGSDTAPTEGDVQRQMKELFDKDYARTTVATFLKKLEDKGYLEKRCSGRRCFLYAGIPARDYGRDQLQLILQRYYQGDIQAFLEDAGNTR